MDIQALIIWLIVGAIAGWLAGMVVKGGGYGLIGDIIVGIIGGLIAGGLLPQIGIVIGGGIIAAIINAFIGAVILDHSASGRAGGVEIHKTQSSYHSYRGLTLQEKAFGIQESA
jgi:uncharacterized membrane protein YeaQ/YmgE (transglycosylase-associated protein family)